MGSCAVGLLLVMFPGLRHCMMRVSALNVLDKSVSLSLELPFHAWKDEHVAVSHCFMM